MFTVRLKIRKHFSLLLKHVILIYVPWPVTIVICHLMKTWARIGLFLIFENWERNVKIVVCFLLYYT